MEHILRDWHLHTCCSCDEACMEFEDLITSADQLGLVEYCVTDHLHTQFNEPDIARSRKAYDAAMERHPELKGKFHFGVEASVMSQWEIGQIAKGVRYGTMRHGIREGGPPYDKPVIMADAEFVERYGIEVVVTGVHWSLYSPNTPEDTVRDFFRQYMFAATHPQTDILAHVGWWFPVLAIENPSLNFSMKDPFLDFAKAFTPSMRDELQAAVLENNTAMELNRDMVVYNPYYPQTFKDEYLGWFADLQYAGVTLAWGSDCHEAVLNPKDYDFVPQLLHYGIDPEKFFKINS